MKTVLHNDRKHRSLGVRCTSISAYLFRLFVGCAVICTVRFVPSVTLADDTDIPVTTSVIEPADVFVHIKLVNKELEHLRFVMGRPKNDQPELDVTNAAPREVFFQALTLFRKADRLSFEYTRQYGEEPEIPSENIETATVFNTVDAALERLRSVKQRLGISYRATPSSPAPSHTPTHVFREIVQANRQLNLLLDRQFSPADVYQQVTAAVGYASQVLAQFPEATRLPAVPKFIPGKQPTDVYQRLTVCLERVRRISEISGQNMLTLTVTEEQWAVATSSDVYDVASLLVSELAFLHSQLPNAKMPRRVVHPGRRFPSHVYQRAGLLERQLMELEHCVTAQPDWLQSDSTEP